MESPILKVVFVIGPNHVGKSTYIADNLRGEALDVIDIYQFQHHESYPETMSEMLKTRMSYALMEDEVSHVLQRALFMEAGMRSLYKERNIDISNREPELIVIEGTYLKRARRASLVYELSQRLNDREKFSFECICIDNDRAGLDRDLLEIPTTEEGFHTVTLIHDFETAKPLEELGRIVDAQKKRDRVRENNYFNNFDEKSVRRSKR